MFVFAPVRRETLHPPAFELRQESSVFQDESQSEGYFIIWPRSASGASTHNLWSNLFHLLSISGVNTSSTSAILPGSGRMSKANAPPL